MASNQEESGYLLEKEGQPEKSGQLAKPKLKFSDACAQSELIHSYRLILLVSFCSCIHH